MGEAPIPDDVMKLADAAFAEAYEECSCLPIARAILADREAQAKRVEELEEVLVTVRAMRSVETLAPAVHDFEREKRSEVWAKIDEMVDRALLAKEGSDA